MTVRYEQDLNLWARQTADLLRERRWQDIDRAHLIEELEELSRSEKRVIASRLIRLLLHLLKWDYQPQRRSDSWLDSITDARVQIALAIQDSPSLRSYPAEQLAACYPRARRSAIRQNGLPAQRFPEDCPYALEQVLDEDWLPG